jgi:serine/threonine-protein kinase
MAKASSRLSSSSTSDFDEGRFLPGAMLAERYRILGCLGKGGMGEVYRASDLRLGQTVALKFLPETMAQDPATLARFYNEVRIARQVTHPNVCRVFDIGDVDGQPFLSMQYVDGENLASLLLRIGRLPSDKAVEFTRRLCAGLAAAHSQGVLHRDLKPANIMIDGRGQVLITDFGLAGLVEEIGGSDIRSGTPAYMSPEQLAGKEVTVKSDIYALGLVVYEMFTGRRAFEAATLAELIRLREESRPPEISSVVREIDPAIERVIMRCLDPDPLNRPASALAVSAALPGGDPLAAALAAGETPSPEMVAAAGSQEGIRPFVAISLLAGVLIALVAVLFLQSSMMLVSKVNLEMPPEALAAQAHRIIQQLGYTRATADRAWNFDYNWPYIQYRDQARKLLDWTVEANRQPAPVLFWYRESPRPLEPDSYGYGRVTLADPPLAISGMTNIVLDPAGRMASFSAVPAQVDESPPSPLQPDPTPLFTAAGLDLRNFKPATPQWTPLAATDARAAWTGVFPERSDEPIRIEAAWWHAKPVYFQIIGPWTRPTRMQAQPNSIWPRVQVGLSLLALAGGSLLAWRNLRLGRGDRQGALRIAAFGFLVSIVTWFLSVHRISLSSWGFSVFPLALGRSLWAGAQFWIAYMALEPAVRRRWPQTLIASTRVLAGRWRDPLVARDVLIGVLVGLGYNLIFGAASLISMHYGSTPSDEITLETLLGFRPSLTAVFRQANSGLFFTFFFFLLFFLLRLLVRKEWLAGAIFVLCFALRGLSHDIPVISISVYIVLYGLFIAMLLSFGLLSLAVALFVVDLVLELAFTTNFSAWYGTGSLTLVVVLAALAFLGFRKALAGQRLFGALLDQ